MVWRLCRSHGGPEASCSRIPEGVSDLDAANIIYAYGSAQYGLIARAQLKVGKLWSQARRVVLDLPL